MPCLFAKYPTVNSNLVPVTLTLLHDGQNRNLSSITLEKIKEAEESLKNKPILAYLNRDENGSVDFGGHEVEFYIDTENENEPLKVRYLEVPVGIIPESTKIGYYAKDGKTYMTCTGYIYAEYSNETIDLLSETDGKCVSVELNVNDGDFNDEGVFEINSFEFLGVTILSDTVTPGMDENCRIELLSDETRYEEFISKATKDVTNFEQDGTLDDGDDKPDEEPKAEHEQEHESEPESNPEPEVTEKEESTIDFSIFGEDVKSIDDLKAKYDELVDELNSLREYKNTTESQKRLDEIELLLTDFEEVKDEAEGIIEKAKNFEITVQELRGHLYAIVGMKAMEKKNTKKSTNFSRLELQDSNSEPIKESPYGGLLNDILGY